MKENVYTVYQIKMGSDHNVAWVMGDLQYDKSYFTCASHMLIICQKRYEVLHSTTATRSDQVHFIFVNTNRF